jgi:UDP-N-acetylglucosamine 2-epimerase (non-hydrolysing)
MGLKILLTDDLTNLIGVVVGTRPSLVKQSPVIRELQRQGIPYFLIHTGQHYSYELDRTFFNDLELPEPDVRLQGIEKCQFHGEQTAAMLQQIEQVLLTRRPRVLLVGGDANSNLAGALAARKLNLCLAHDESGLRSYTWNVPEEHNRVVIDHIADYLFVHHERAKQTLEAEGVRGRIFITGSTIGDAVSENFQIAQEKSRILDKLALQPGQYLVMTLHHEENVDYREEIANILQGAKTIGEKFQMPVIFPIHPRTRLRLEQFGLEEIHQHPWIKIVKPLGYLDFLLLVGKACLVMTDSGGLIQEAAIMHVPCLTLGKYTEWTEVLEIGANLVSLNDPRLMMDHAETLRHFPRDWPDPFGQPGAAQRIVESLKTAFV